MSLVSPSLSWIQSSTNKWAVVAVFTLRLSLTAAEKFVGVIFFCHLLWYHSFQKNFLVIDISCQTRNGCEHFGHLCVSYRNIINRGWGLTLGQVRGFIFIFLVQVEPAFLQRIHFLILGIRVPALVNVVQIMGRKLIITTGNTSLIPFTIKHSIIIAVATAAAAGAITATPPAVTTSGLFARSRICWQNITVDEFTAFR